MFHTGGKANISNTTQQNREGLKKRFLGGKFSQCEPTHRPTHPRVFVRFGKTKVEICAFFKTAIAAELMSICICICICIWIWICICICICQRALFLNCNCSGVDEHLQKAANNRGRRAIADWDCFENVDHYRQLLTIAHCAMHSYHNHRF